MSTEQFYDKNADKFYDTIRSNEAPWPPISEYSISTIIHKENISLNNANIIDIGCGKGTISRFLASKYPTINKITAIDLSRSMIETARAETEHEYNNIISYHQGNILKLSSLKQHDIKLASYDIAIVLFVFNYASTKEELAAMIENISLLLKPNGCIIGLGPSPDDYRIINAANDNSYYKYGVRIHLNSTSNRKIDKLYDGYKYSADVYACDNSQSIDNPKGNFMHFEEEYFYSRNRFDEYFKKFGFTRWKWFNYFIPDKVRTKHKYIDWDGVPYCNPDMLVYATKCIKHKSKL